MDGSPINAVMIVALGASVPVCFLLRAFVRWRYLATIRRIMRSGSGQRLPLPPPEMPTGAPLDVRTEDTPRPRSYATLDWRLGIAHLAAGAAHAAVAVAVLFALEGITALPLRSTIVWLMLCWPALLSGALAAGVRGAAALVVTAGAFALIMLASLMLYGEADTVEMMFLAAWLSGAGIIGALFLIPRRWRGTALLIAGPVIVTIVTAFVLLDIVAAALEIIGSFELALLALAMAGALALALGWGAFRLGAELAERLRLDDVTLQVAGLWTLVSFYHVAIFVGAHGAAGLAMCLPFAAWAMAIRLLRPRPETGAPRPLLLLRNFGFRDRQEALLAGDLRLWRRRGPILMIGARDVALDTFDAPELLAFATGRTAELVADAPEKLDARIAASLAPGVSGLYPVEDIYCDSDGWQAMVARLIKAADTIVIDARGHEAGRRGLEWELSELMRRAEPERVLVLVGSEEQAVQVGDLMQAEWRAHHAPRADARPRALTLARAPQRAAVIGLGKHARRASSLCR